MDEEVVAEVIEEELVDSDDGAWEPSESSEGAKGSDHDSDTDTSSSTAESEAEEAEPAVEQGGQQLHLSACVSKTEEV
jgi:hypothetical protein